MFYPPIKECKFLLERVLTAANIGAINMIHLAFYVPESHAEHVKSALFAAGAGRIGNYECCSFESGGTGQYRPLEGSQPFLGESGRLEKVNELKVEMVCEEQHLEKVIAALRHSHPYETPAFYAIKTLDF
jgi:hypothetical protein